MQNLTLCNMQWTIVDDAFDRTNTDWIGISSGDIFWLNKQHAWGSYVAKWKPNQNDDLKLQLMSLNEQHQVDLVIGFSCQFGNLESLTQIEPKDIPWDTWGVEPISIAEFSFYGKAQQAFEIAKLIIQKDLSLAKSLGFIDISLIEFSGYVDEYGYRTLELQDN